MAKRLTDEEIVSALIECGTIKGASEKLGVQLKTLYSRMKKEQFRELYNRAKSIADIMRDKETSQQVRLNASDCIIRNTIKLLEQTDIIERIEHLEEQTKENIS